MKELFTAVILWSGGSDPISAEQYCDAVVVCSANTSVPSCDVLVWGPCAMGLEECLESEVQVRKGAPVDVLGCAPHAREAVVDRATILRARKATK